MNTELSRSWIGQDRFSQERLQRTAGWPIPGPLPLEPEEMCHFQPLCCTLRTAAMGPNVPAKDGRNLYGSHSYSLVTLWSLGLCHS